MKHVLLLPWKHIYDFLRLRSRAELRSRDAAALSYFLPLPFWDRALAAAVLDAELVRPSLRTLLAAEAALLLVCLLFFAIICPVPK